MIIALLLIFSLVASSGSSFAASANLISNPGVETGNITNPTMPQGWKQRKWGTNDGQLTWQNTGHSGGHSLGVKITNYTSGDVKWGFDPVTAVPGSVYSYSDYYMSDTVTDVGMFYTDASGNSIYKYLGSASASPGGWNQYSTTFTAPAGAQTITVVHLLYKVGSLQTDDFKLTQLSTPQVSISSPKNGDSLNGITNLSAEASDSSGITGLQFKLDGAPLGSPLSSGPYQLSWDTTSVSNGVHTLTAVATNADGQSSVSSPVSVTVNNSLDNPNIIPNSSMETVDPTRPSKPANWDGRGSGINTTTYSYLTNFAHSGTHSVKTEMTQYTSGSAHWRNVNVPITGGQLYDVSEYYQSNVKTDVDAAITMSDGSVRYLYLNSPSPSPNGWTRVHQQFVAPAGAVSVSMFHEIHAVGWVITDDYSLKTFSYQGFNRPIITITDDDGFSSYYNYGLPLLNKYGLTATDYIISSDPTRGSAYMNAAMIKGLYDNGHEIGSHTVTHSDLTTLSASQLDSELSDSQTFLQNLIGVPVTNVAFPYGTYNQQVLDNTAKYYRSARTVQAGYNAKNNFDPNQILVQNLHSNTTLAEVQSWIDQAKATNTWLVLVYHQVDPNTSAGLYNTYPSDFDAQLSAIKQSGVAVETIEQALNEIRPQLN